ncbi:MAG: hypothetical protein IJ193_03020 [Bacilli bacterium]|nr:hypothetical protein [Bacilli bacterium]
MKLRNIGITAAVVATGFVLIPAFHRDSYEDKHIYNTSIRSLTENRKDTNTILDDEEYNTRLHEFERAYYAIEKIGELDYIKEGYEYDIDSYLKEEADEFELRDIAIYVNDFDDMKLDDYRRLRMKNQLAYLNDKYKSWILENGYSSASYLMGKMVESEVCSTIDKNFSDCHYEQFHNDSIIPYAEVSSGDQVITIDYRSGNLYWMSKLASQFKNASNDSFKETYKDMGTAMKYLKKSIGTKSVIEDGVIKTRS